VWLPFAFLLVGMVFAYQLKNWADPAIRAGLTVLLLGMGIHIGSDRQLLLALPRLGIESVLFCLLSCLASLVLVMAWEKLFIKEYRYAHASSETTKPSDEYNFIILVIICLVFGIVIGKQTNILTARAAQNVIDLALIIIYIGIGVTLRFAIHKLSEARTGYLMYLLLPVLITLGSIIGGVMAGAISGKNLNYAGAIGAGMAYYSLAAAMITDQAGFNLGLIALISNFLRELITFLFTPFLARYSNLAPIALGGASTMDTTLAVMKQNLNEKYTLVAFFNGVILSFMVPVVLLLLLGTS
jgi:uncharacterized membrane protein YbjE (DUF340 family)